jgi:hypothetical protein
VTASTIDAPGAGGHAPTAQASLNRDARPMSTPSVASVTLVASEPERDVGGDQPQEDLKWPARASSVASVALVASESKRDGSGDHPRQGGRQWPAPLGPDALIGVAGELVRATSPHTEADPAAILLQFIVAFGSALGRTAYYQVEADKHFLNLYGLLVGRTASGRKGTSLSHAKRAVVEADPTWAKRIVSGLASGEGLISHVRDAEFTGGYSGTGAGGASDRRLFVTESEFGKVLRVMQREGNTLSSVVREAWDSGNIGTMTKNSPVRATGAHISIVAHITAEELLRYLNRVEVSNGFLNRFAIIAVDRSKILPDGGSLPEKALQPIIERVREALSFGRTTGRMERNSDARELWYGVYERLTSDKPGATSGITSRAAPMAVRVACLFALLDLSREVRREHLAAALEVNRYVDDSVTHLFGGTLGDVVADKILSALRRSTAGLTRTEIRDELGRHQGEREIERALAHLLENDLARVTTRPTGGRTAQLWVAINATNATQATERSAVGFVSDCLAEKHKNNEGGRRGGE